MPPTTIRVGAHPGRSWLQSILNHVETSVSQSGRLQPCSDNLNSALAAALLNTRPSRVRYTTRRTGLMIASPCRHRKLIEQLVPRVRSPRWRPKYRRHCLSPDSVSSSSQTFVGLSSCERCTSTALLCHHSSSFICLYYVVPPLSPRFVPLFLVAHAFPMPLARRAQFHLIHLRRTWVDAPADSDG